MTTAQPPVALSTLPEELLLDHFWAAQADHVVDRLELLKHFSVIAVERPAAWDPKAVRAACRNDGLTAERCFACLNGDRRLYWHHIVEVHHGGSNDPRNRVALCFRCHKVIHPFLQEWDGDHEKRERWTSVGELVQTLVDGLKTGTRLIA